MTNQSLTRQINVVCVDDSFDICNLLCIRINDERDMICDRTFTDAAGLLDFLETAPEEKLPDIVVMDWILPGQAAPNIITGIVRRRGGPEAKVIIFSGHDDSVIRERAVNAGASGCVPKHAGFDAVITAIRQVAGGATLFDQ